VTAPESPHLDDRGQPCTIAPLSPGQKALRAFGIVDANPDAAARGEYSMNPWLENAVSLSGAAVGLVFSWFVLLPFLVSEFRFLEAKVFTMLIPSVTAIVFALTAWWVFLGRIRRSNAPRIAGVYLRSGRCASCGYDLRNLDPEADGCVLCPECSAAWLAARIGAEDSDGAR